MSAPVEGARHQARELVFRVAYQSDLIGDSIGELWKQLPEAAELADDPRELATDLTGALSANLASIDESIASAASHWPLARLAATDRAVLRLAVAELIARPGTPARVVLDEAIMIARRFGSDESGGFVNGVLDRVARTLRPAEFA
ncbi:MAG: transcription antitermination factor NusB [Candidatus Eisenbacteria bacterium]|uniref:Transcription antitermination protein NusB n=1 Tax=Eiseniibacteriota bacterium TaxID=2212470 RepID=A0A849T1J5_UNCEI|nr:transcription antitermination factor NusB [Candidatus Eisenbacteria bacterium]